MSHTVLSPESAEVPSEGSALALLESFWQFLPAFQRWTESCSDGLSAQRMRILTALHERGPLMMREIKTALGVTATNITALVDALEKDALVERRPHPSDRRATLIALSPRAVSCMAVPCARYREQVAALFAVLSEPEQQTLLRLLQQLNVHLQTQSVVSDSP